MHLASGAPCWGPALKRAGIACPGLSALSPSQAIRRKEAQASSGQRHVLGAGLQGRSPALKPSGSLTIALDRMQTCLRAAAA